MLSSFKILFIVTSHSILGNTGESTGVWLEELAAPYYEFIEKGYQVDIVSIDGGAIPIDPRSSTGYDLSDASKKFLNDSTALRIIKNTLSIKEIKNIKEYNAIFIPGGHGVMWDMVNNEKLKKLLKDAYEADKIIASVCHGPAAFIGVKLSNGDYLVKNKNLTAFTNEEERLAKLDKTVPFLLQSELEKQGAIFIKSEAFTPNSIKDHNLITGQNPASSKDVARLVIESLSK